MLLDMQFNEQFIIANLYHLTHYRTGLKGAMLESGSLEARCPLDDGRHEEQISPSASLGNLERLLSKLLYAKLIIGNL